MRCDWQGADDEAMQLGETGAPVRHVTDSVMNPEAGPALRPQHHVPAAQVHLAPPGMTCRSLASGHGFRVSVEKQERF